MTEQAITDLWITSLQDAYRFWKGERSHELTGRFVKRFDDRGTHPASVMVGQVYACQSLVPELLHADFSPVEIRRAAREDAYEQFANDLVARLKARAEEAARSNPERTSGAGEGVLAEPAGPPQEVEA